MVAINTLTILAIFTAVVSSSPITEEKRLLVGPTSPPAGYVNSGKPCDDKYFCTILEGQPKGSVCVGGKTGSVTGMCYNPPAASSEKRLLVGPTNPPAGYVNSGKPCDDKYFCTILEGQPKGSVCVGGKTGSVTGMCYNPPATN